MDRLWWMSRARLGSERLQSLVWTVAAPDVGCSHGPTTRDSLARTKMRTRGDWIRTSGLLLPKQALCQAELRPVGLKSTGFGPERRGYWTLRRLQCQHRLAGRGRRIVRTTWSPLAHLRGVGMPLRSCAGLRYARGYTRRCDR